MKNKIIIESKYREYVFVEGIKNISELYFNPYNTRQEANLSKMRNESDDFKDALFQGKIYNLFIKDTGTDKSSLEDSIKRMKGIDKPLYITSDGYVLSGNNRLSILKKLENKKYDMDYNVSVFSLEGKELEEFEMDYLETILQYRGEEKVNYESHEKAAKMFKLLEKNNQSIEEVAEMFSTNKKNVNEHINSIKEFYIYLNFVGNTEYKNLLSEVDAWSTFLFLGSDTFKKSTQKTKNTMRNILYNTIPAKISFREMRGIINMAINADLNQEDKDNLLTYIEIEINEKTKDSVQYGKKLIQDGKKLKRDPILQTKINEMEIKPFLNNLSIEVKKNIDSNSNPGKETLKTIKKIEREIKMIKINDCKERKEIVERLNSIFLIIELKLNE